MTAWHELARASAERMLNGMVEGLVIALFAALLLHMVRRQNLRWRNSGIRFAILLAALFSIAALPVLTIVTASSRAVPRGGAVWAVTMPGLWATYALLAWAVIAMAGLLRVALGLWQLRTVRAGSEIIDLASLDPILRSTLGEFESSRQVRIAVSEKVMVPAAIGFFRPMIVLPKWALRELSITELDSILIHELAHLRRRDDWTNLAQKVLRALLFFHPAVWWVERQLSLEREMACDDVVLARRDDPRAYAECLVTVAERSFMRRGLALAQAAVSKMRQTTLRVSQILDGNRSAGASGLKPALGLIMIASGVLVVALARAPELIAFRDGGAPAASSSLVSVVASASVPKDIPIPTAKAVLTSFRPKRKGQSRSAAVAAMEAKLTPQQPSMDSPGRAAAASKQDEAPAQTVLVVMRTEQFGPAGASWTVQVWRFTMLKAEEVPVGLRNPAKSL